MAVTFNPATGDSVVIGGTDATGPNPKYSISAERVQSEQGILLDVIYSITITGSMIASGNITSPGARQGSLMARQNALLALLENKRPTGTLDIDPYGSSGAGQSFTFSDARLVSVDFPEGDDETGGTQTAEYTFNFEAHAADSGKQGSIYYLSSAEENWSLAENEGQIFVNSEATVVDDPDTEDKDEAADAKSGLSGTLFKTYTLTHTISATGYDKYTSGAWGVSGWAEAQKWVNSRLVANPIAKTITTDEAGNTATSFKVDRMGMLVDVADDASTTEADESEDNISMIDLSTYTAYDYKKEFSPDTTGGTYAITETWILSKQNHTVDFDMSFDTDEEGVSTVNFNCTITGLSSSLDIREQNKITNAETALAGVLNDSYSLSNTFYQERKSINPDTEGADTLATVEQAISISKNRISGVITVSMTYNDKPQENEDTIEESIELTDNNRGHTNRVIALLAVIGKDNGPVIQDMGTSGDQRRSVTLSWTFKKEIEHEGATVNIREAITNYIKNSGSNISLGKTKVESAESAVNSYRPAGTQNTNYWQQSYSQSWNESTGALGINVEWAY